MLDYARAISRWTYSDLQRQVAMATGLGGNVPFELTRQRMPDLQEQRFVDQTAAAMRQGRLLLLIAGDGIREDVGALTELINRNAASGFAFGLVEVALYGLEDESLVIQPRVVARTQIIERTVVVVRDAQGTATLRDDEDGALDLAGRQTGSARDSDLGESPEQAAYRAWWAPVLQAPLDDPDQEPFKLFWRNNIRSPLPWPGTWVLAYTNGGERGEVTVCVSGRASAWKELTRVLWPHRRELLEELPPGTELRVRDGDGAYVLACSRRASEFASEDEKRAFLIGATNAFVNDLRPRIKALLAEAPFI